MKRFRYKYKIVFRSDPEGRDQFNMMLFIQMDIYQGKTLVDTTYIGMKELKKAGLKIKDGDLAWEKPKETEE